jgi:hypothetical protein
MPTSTKVKNLNINELTEAQYDAAVQGGVIGANELSVLTDVSYVEPSDLATVATTGDYSDLINRPTNLVSTNTAQTISGLKTFSGDITLSGTTSIKNNTGGTNYTMLYRDASTIHVGASTSALKLEGSGTRPAYNNDSLALLSDITGGLPSQTGHSGEFLTTDGTDASWSDKPLVNASTLNNSVVVAGTDSSNGGANTILGKSGTASGTAYRGAAFGMSSKIGKPGTTTFNTVAFGADADAQASYGMAIGGDTVVTGDHAIQLGSTGNTTTNSDANTVKIANANGNYEMMSADGTIPEARLADTTNAAQGQVLALDSNLDAVWTTPSGGGLPSQTGNAGKFLTTDGTDASWGAINALENKATFGTPINGIGIGNVAKANAYRTIVIGEAATDNTNVGSAGNYQGVAIGYKASITGNNAIAIGQSTESKGIVIGQESQTFGNDTICIGKSGRVSGDYSVGIGWQVRITSSRTFVIGVSNGQYINDPNSFYLVSGSNNYKMLDLTDGTIPTARLTKVNTTITLAAADWSSNTQTVSVTGMTATGVVLVSPDPTDQSAYTSAGIICSAQAAGTLTFTCSTTPSADLSVNVVML